MALVCARLLHDLDSRQVLGAGSGGNTGRSHPMRRVDSFACGVWAFLAHNARL